jgi:uncharacterized protein
MAGEPIHFEIGVADGRWATTFYSRLFDWTLHPMGEGPEGRTETDGVRGGLHEHDPSPGVVVYFHVPDIEAALTRVGDFVDGRNRPPLSSQVSANSPRA